MAGVKVGYAATDNPAMTPQARTCVFVLALATALGWYAGVALLPLTAWVVYEVCLALARPLRSILVKEAALHQ